jgi:mycothiol synthase
MRASELPAGMIARPAAPADVDAVAELVAAYEIEVIGEADVNREDVLGDWRRPSFDLARQSMLVREGTDAVAEAEVTPSRERVEAAVHPRHWGRGIGSWLLDWSEAAAVDVAGTASVVLSQTVSDSNERARRLLSGRGYRPRYQSWVLGIQLDAPTAAVELPEGIVARTFDAVDDARSVHTLLHDAFSEWPNWEPVPFDDWRALILDRSDFDPELTIVAHDGGELVGVAVCFETGDDGWVAQLAVRRSHRRRGLGRALLQESFRRFYERGLRAAGLNTDSRAGALGMYERVGMRIRRSYTNYAKELRTAKR